MADQKFLSIFLLSNWINKQTMNTIIFIVLLSSQVLLSKKYVIVEMKQLSALNSEQ